MMSFSGHSVCHSGLNWCIFVGFIFIFPALAKGLCCLFFLGEENAFKCQNPYAFKNQILQNICLNGITGKLFGIFGQHFTVFSCFVNKNVFIC